MAVIAFLDLSRRYAGGGDLALDWVIVLVENLGTFAGDDDPVAFFQIGNLLRQRRECQCV